MHHPLARAAAAAALVAVAVAGIAWLVVYFSGGGGEASQPISAPQLTAPPASQAAAPTPAAQPAAASPAAASPTAARSTPAAASPAAASPAPDSTVAASPTAASAAAADARLYRIIPAESEARYEIDELLRDVPTHVVGRTDQVAGDIIVDFGNPSASQVGVIRINVRTLRTDEERRDRATRSRILQSAEDRFEFAEFAPRALEGLPAAIAVGDTVSFTIVGDLTVRDITAEARFEATVTIVADDRIEGSATATVSRQTYDLVIPSVPFVAGVSDEVLLGIEFTAEAVPA